MRLVLPAAEFATGRSYPVLMEITIKDGYHINSSNPKDATLIPTKVFFTASGEQATLGRVVYPEAELKKFAFSMTKLAIYEGTVYITTSVSITEGGESGITLDARLEYQACTDTACLLPAELTQSVLLRVGANGEPLEPELFDKYASLLSVPSSGGGIFEKFGGAATITMLFLVFIGGLALNLTPCVYPIIPITVGYFGAATGRSRREIFSHALVYLLGLALMYSTLGTVAAITGSLFGEIMQNSFVITFLVAIVVALSLSMFGVYNIPVPSLLLRASSKSYSGFFGTFFMGVMVGVVAAPCVGPFIIGLITFVGERQDPLLGFTLFFTLALGMGLPFVALAFFSGALGSLPRAGEWMVWVKKFFGVALLGMALYFAEPLLSEKTLRILALTVALAGGTYLMIAGRKTGGAVFNVFRFALSGGVIALGIWYSMLSGAPGTRLEFKEYSDAAFEEALKKNRPVVIDFTADWCLPCRELEIYTFGDKRVVARAAEFEPLEVDLTRMSAEEKRTKEKFAVYGVPTVILFDYRGRELDRFTGFITADEFLKKLDALIPPAKSGL
ncbi:MAG: thiol:disulfide interchange protein DsbD [bacterium]|nr:MAG: thiol:disulfide interchange protein DsbD [bacterium]